MSINQQQIVSEALSYFQQSQVQGWDENSTLEDATGTGLRIYRNSEGSFLSVSLPLGGEESSELMEQLLRVSCESTYGDLVVGGMSPEQRVLLSAIIPLNQVSEEELKRRVDKLLTTAASIEQTAETNSLDRLSAEQEDGEADAMLGAWMRI